MKKLWGGGVRILAQGVFGRNCGAVVLGFWCRECLKELRGVGVLVQGVFCRNCGAVVLVFWCRECFEDIVGRWC